LSDAGIDRKFVRSSPMKFLSTLQIAVTASALIAASSVIAQTTNPKPVTFPSPKYPAELVDTGTNGEATIDVTIKSDGSVANPVLKSTDNPAFGAEAMAVIEQWKFTPGMRDGAPIEMKVAIPFQFRAPFDQKINAMAKRKVYQQLPEPALTQKEYKSKLKVKAKARPAYPKALAKSGLKEDVKVKFVVTPEGTVVNPQFDKEPHVQLLVPSIAAVAMMSFEPPMKDKKGVYVEATETLHFEEPPPAPPGGRGKKGKDGGGADGPPGAGDP
jgi:TonB family protein